MGGDDSQKLVPWRGSTPLRGAKPPAQLHYEFNTVAENCAAGNLPSLPQPKPGPVVAQLPTPWVILGKHTWVISPARRSICLLTATGCLYALEFQRLRDKN